MTADSCKDVQAGIYTVLSTDTTLTALLQGRIFDHVPQGTAFPYAVIGEMKAQALDTQASSGNEIEVTLQVYSRARGWLETQNVLSALRNALHEVDFSVPNQILILCRFAGAELAAGADGETRMGVARFHVITEPA